MAKMTIPDFMQIRREGRKIACMTAYDYNTAQILDRAGADMLLVGDSGARYLLGHSDNNHATMDEMIIMTRSVARGAERAFVIGDMPFMSYQVNIEEAVRNAGRFIKEAGADAVKLEGGANFAPTIAAIVQAGIPVQGHFGQTPMTTMGMGLHGYDQTPADADVDALIRDAQALEAAGCFSLILTRISPADTAKINQKVNIPTLGGGPSSNGQAGVIGGLLGMGPEYIDGSRSRYGPVAKVLYEAASAYVADVRAARAEASEAAARSVGG
ncbi:MAG TPA: 3-methyl-2-oxobutanoate hydroxymethyltransferase [Chloroflexota bacterium]|jgi:3-methyl-2-oxobutanoate hydroxymethyltransferase